MENSKTTLIEKRERLFVLANLFEDYETDGSLYSVYLKAIKALNKPNFTGNIKLITSEKELLLYRLYEDQHLTEYEKDTLRFYTGEDF